MSKLINAVKALVGVSPFVHPERDLATMLGVSQDDVKARRQALQLTRGADWDLVKNVVTYTEAGAKKILEALSVAPSAGGAEPPAAADLAPNTPPAVPDPAAAEARATAWPPAAAGDVVDLICAKLPRNQRIILARAADAPRGSFVRVRVKDSSKFTVGMELKARHLSEDLYQLEGHGPRFSGKY